MTTTNKLTDGIIATVLERRGIRLRNKMRQLVRDDRDIRHAIGIYGMYLNRTDISPIDAVKFTETLQGFSIAYRNNLREMADTRKKLFQLSQKQSKLEDQ